MRARAQAAADREVRDPAGNPKHYAHPERHRIIVQQEMKFLEMTTFEGGFITE